MEMLLFPQPFSGDFQVAQKSWLPPSLPSRPSMFLLPHRSVGLGCLEALSQLHMKASQQLSKEEFFRYFRTGPSSRKSNKELSLEAPASGITALGRVRTLWNTIVK